MGPVTDMSRGQRGQPGTRRGRPGAVLICYDGSNPSKAAIAEAGRELGPGRRALVLTVWEPFAATGFSLVSIPVAGAADERLKRQAEKVAEEGTALARQGGFDAEPLVEPGVPVWDRIAEVANEREVDLIVVGSHGRSGMRYLLHGSVSIAVAQHADRPVLIVSDAGAQADPVATQDGRLARDARRRHDGSTTPIPPQPAHARS
jgi:nucleotide-binding universal stress UspA family protein